LIPLEERPKLLANLLASTSGFSPGDYIRGGTLSPRNKAIYDALLTSYQGDYVQVLRHVRVERFEIAVEPDEFAALVRG